MTRRLATGLHEVFWNLHARTWDTGVPSAERAARCHAVVNWVRSECDVGAPIIDIGCATGALSVALADAPWPTLHAFDGALMLGVLQCVSDPTTFLRTVHDLLRPNGVILIEVKDADSARPVARGAIT